MKLRDWQEFIWDWQPELPPGYSVGLAKLAAIGISLHGDREGRGCYVDNTTLGHRMGCNRHTARKYRRLLLDYRAFLTGETINHVVKLDIRLPLRKVS